MYEIIPKGSHLPKIVVFGVGGCGCNTINQLSLTSLSDNVHLIAVNTDTQSLAAVNCSARLQIGAEATNGLGAGSDPQRGLAAAQESEIELIEHITTADVIFVTGGMGGGTGTGAIPFIVSLAERLEKSMVAVVTAPFGFEGQYRNALAKNGLEQLKEHASSLIVLPNDKLVKTLDKKISLVNAFFESNRVLQDVLIGLTTTISQSGFINIDLNDFIAVVNYKGRAAMGVARQDEAGDIPQTIEKALKNPLLEDIELTNAKGAIVSVITTNDIELNQYYEIGEQIQQQLAPNTHLIMGLTLVEDLDCELELMIIVTGISSGALNSTNTVSKTGLNVALNVNSDPNHVVISPQCSDKKVDDNLLNVHDFLKQKAGRFIDDSELDIPAYTRLNQ
ncbi:cell division protein FtsZ [Shewanella sp. Isolate11]|uniref:cell division protein FtsZ n=1 Tax=Shewanella sp. Isolate11 TaxID=2908530 RepID=UPI001EFD1855|nr:cell division protein FtsZ [Shewanella sp. Isolate11]MCG9698362.1 cell division FtsZ family protein [Shewanella sp. Isolate11]